MKPAKSEYQRGLEDAAKVCERGLIPATTTTQEFINANLEACAQAIRALSAASDQTGAEDER